MKTFPKSTEQIQDIVAALLVEGTGVTLAYNDGAGTLTISSSVDLTGYATTAYVDDEVSANGVSLQAFASNAANLASGTVPFARLPVGTTSVTVAAGNHTHTSAAISDFSEAVDDEVATLLQAGTDVTVTYNDAGNTLTVGLGSNVPRLNAANTFSQTQTFSGTIIVGTGVSIVRNATGPTLETRAAGGLKVCNADGSAVAAVQCSNLTASGVFTTDFGSGVDIQTQAANYRIGHRVSGTFRTGFDVYHLNMPSSYLLRWSNSGSSITTLDTTISRASAGVIQVGSGSSANANGSLLLTDVTASGVAKFTGYPTSLLPAAASNAGSITYDTTISKHVGCNGSSWNALW